MANEKIEKQNGALKIVLLILLIIGVSAASIAGYHYYPVLFKNTEPWEKADSSKRDRSGARSDRSATTAPATTTTTTSPTPAAPAPSATPAAAQSAPSSPKDDSARFAGAWEFTGAKGATYRRTYTPARFDNGFYVGEVADENGTNFAIYTVAPGNKLTLEILISNALNTAGEKNTYDYRFSNNGNTFTLSRNGGVLSTWKRQ